jgi:branched-chain amino acid transport system permease protein
MTALAIDPKHRKVIFAATVITPASAFTVFWSAYIIFIVVSGGMGTLTGPLIGAALYAL